MVIHLWPIGQFHQCWEIKFYWNAAIPIWWHAACGSVVTAIVELNDGNDDPQSLKYLLFICIESLPILAWGEMAQWINRLPLKHEDLSVSFGTYVKKARHGGTHLWSYLWVSRNRVIPGVCGPAILAQLLSFKAVRDPVSRRLMKRTPKVIFWLHTHAHTFANAVVTSPPHPLSP